MKCDELKVYVHKIKKSVTGHTYIGLAYYSKSEVDSAIAELKEFAEDACLERDDNQTVIEELNEENRKMKRALWLARAQEWRNYAAFCGMQSHCHNHRGFGKTAEKWTWKEIHAWKCVHRYKELAEKFKETK